MPAWITDIFEALTAPFTEYLPKLLGAIGDGFVTLFIETGTEGAIEGLKPLGWVGVLFMGVAICAGLVPMLLRFLKLRGGIRRGRRRRRARA